MWGKLGLALIGLLAGLLLESSSAAIGVPDPGPETPDAVPLDGASDGAAAATAFNHRGNLALDQGDREAARGFYLNGLGTPGVPNASLAVLELNLARIEEGDAARRRLRHALELAPQEADPLHRGTLLAAIGDRAIRVGDREVAYNALVEAIRTLRPLGQEHLLSQAIGRLGELYGAEGRKEEALALTAEAIRLAAAIPAPELLMQWEWQQGRLHRDAGRTAPALASYRRAVTHLDSVRADIPILYRDGRSSFRDTLGPLYLELIDLLLTEAGTTPDDLAQPLLAEAQRAMERFKGAELQDYFRDACAAPPAEIADLADPGTAVLYPIVLPQRLELLLQIGGTRHRRALPIAADELARLVGEVANGLRPTAGGRLRPYPKGQAQRLHQLLIAPLAQELAQVHTLVYLPDGVLRGVPLAALWDGERFLVERFAVATEPGLTLLDPRPLPRHGLRALLAGLARPGPVVGELPEAMRAAVPADLDEPAPAGEMVASRQLRVRALPQGTPGSIPLSRTAERALQEQLSLPGVEEELAEIAQLLPSRRLLDEGFRRESFEREIASGYRIVHVASHGFFSGDPELSFLLTHDKLLPMSRLEGLFKSERFSDLPVELLTLSACETAEGDDRSPLGLSGVALRSGARSALGSLWPVSDEATQQLLPAFYRALLAGQTSKAEALRQAQLELLRKGEYDHPLFWAPFILIGNWL